MDTVGQINDVSWHMVGRNQVGIVSITDNDVLKAYLVVNYSGGTAITFKGVKMQGIEIPIEEAIRVITNGKGANLL